MFEIQVDKETLNFIHWTQNKPFLHKFRLKRFNIWKCWSLKGTIKGK